MKEAIVAKAYAQALIQIGEEKKVEVANELTSLNEAINSSNELESLLFFGVFTEAEKSGVLEIVMKKLNLSAITTNFLNFLLQEGRISLFPLIFKEVIVIDDHKRGFLRGTVEGGEDTANAEFVAKIKTYLQQKIGKNIELTYEKNKDIAAGYRVTVEDLQLDASLENQLNQFKDSVLNA
ncbi:MAG: ATP synthase F1 subunit delta [Halobacteriovorax sp.]|nr:ATP synthase F1 subunit delta [Halobacteriovorax sp.]